MSRLVISALGAVALLAAVPAQARECVVGWITHVDQLNDTVTLDSGRILAVSGDINIESLRDGVYVKLVVSPTRHGPKVVNVAPVPAPQSILHKDGRV